MRLLSIVILNCLFIFSLSSCGPNQREKADYKMNEAKKMIIKGDTIKAIEILESIAVQFPKASDQINVSNRLANELYIKMINVKKEQLTTAEVKISELEKNFTKEKTEFDSYVQYIPKRLSFNQSWNRSFLQISLDDRGEIFLTSNYMGKEWLKHTAIRVYYDGLQIKTPQVPIDDPNNRRSDFLDFKWEKVSYMQGKSDSTIRFIVKNIKRQLKCAFMGTNYYYIILEDFNKEAIRDAYNLSLAIKNRKEISWKIKELEAKRK